MKFSILALATATTLCSAPLLAAGGGSMSTPMPSASAPRDVARDAYNAGVKLVKRADAAAEKGEGGMEKARAGYTKALAKFDEATQVNPKMHQAWSYSGYAHRKLGEYDAALAAYDRALALEPSYAEAIEYRGEALLGRGQIADAQEAYIALFALDRKLADQLLTAMRDWVALRRAASSGTADAEVAAFEQWIEERSRISAQTASLTRESPASDWR